MVRLGLAAAFGAAGASSALLTALPAGAEPRLPRRVAAVYWTHWNRRAVPLREVPPAYNVVYLFAADQRTKDGRAHWDHDEVAADVRFCRARGQRVLLTVGGEGQGTRLADPADAERLVESVVEIDTALGGRPGARALDGVDLNTYEAGVVPDVRGYLWACRELRRRLGPSFALTTPPAAGSERDQVFCRTLLAERAVDYVAPQFYGGPGLADPDFIVSQTARWVKVVAGGDAGRVVVGFGLEDLPDYSSVEEIRQVWPRILRAHPDIRGAFLWQHRTDADRGWPFARRIAPVLERPWT